MRVTRQKPNYDYAYNIRNTDNSYIRSISKKRASLCRVTIK